MNIQGLVAIDVHTQISFLRENATGVLGLARPQPGTVKGSPT
jgi:hypothetical protein